MPHPKGGYRLADGTRVPGVTTIIGACLDKPALITWAYKRGKDGLDLYESRDTACEVGTLAHDLVEQHITGNPPKRGDHPEAAWNAYQQYVEWQEQTRIRIVATEESLVSEEFRYGGTPDAIGLDAKGRYCLLDWKTGSGVYGEQHLPQLAAYIHLWNAAHPDQEITGGAHLCRFAKETADFHHHYYADLSDAWEAFRHMAALYPLVHRLKKRG